MKHETQPTHPSQPQPTETTRRNAGSLPASDSEHSTSVQTLTAADAQAGSATPLAAAAAGTPGLRSDAVKTLAELQAENAALKKQIQEQAAHASLKDTLKKAGARTP